MRRVILLVLLIGTTCAGMVVIIVSVAASGDQFVRRLESQWDLGTLAVDGPRMVDLDTVSFETFRIRAQPPVESPYFLLFRDLEWRRPELLPQREALDLARAQLRFAAGQMNLERGDDTGWNVAGLAATPGDDAGWMARVPAEVDGKALAVKLRRRSPHHPAAMDFLAERIALRRRDAGVEIRCQVLAEPWNDGELIGTVGDAGNTWRVDLHGVALERFPFADLARLFRFPWPVAMPKPSGRAEIVWTRTAAENRVELTHSLATLELDALPHGLRYLNGRATLTPEKSIWNVESGTYSRSALSGRLEVDLGSHDAGGSFTLDGVLEDSKLGDGLPGIWSPFVRALSLTGGGRLTVELSGDARRPPLELVDKLRLVLSDARLEGPLRRGVNGDFILSPSADGWGVSGSTTESQVGGFGLPSSEWRGRLERGGLRLRRDDEFGPQCRIEITSSADSAVSFRVEASKVPLSTLLGKPLGDGEASLIVSGDWTSERGITWRDGWLSWSRMKVHRDVSWPRRLPAGLLSGTIGFRRKRGLTTIPAILVRDDRGLWVARGAVRADGTWELEGTLVDGTTALYPPDAVPRILEQRPGDDPDPERFRIEGRLFDWRVRS